MNIVMHHKSATLHNDEKSRWNVAQSASLFLVQHSQSFGAAPKDALTICDVRVVFEWSFVHYV